MVHLLIFATWHIALLPQGSWLKDTSMRSRWFLSPSADVVVLSEWGHLSFRRILQQLPALSGINRSDCVTKQPMQRLYWLLNQTHRIESFRTLFYISLFTILTKNEPVSVSMKSLLHLHFTAADSLSVCRRKSNHWDTGNTTSSALFFCEHDWHRWGLLSIKAKMGGSGDLMRCTEWKSPLDI